MQRFTKRSRETDDTALSATIDLTQPDDVKFTRMVLSTSKTGANRPWHWYETLGDVVHQGVARGARTAGYAQLGAYTLGADGKVGKQLVGAKSEAVKIADSLSSPYGGQRALLERWFTLSKVPGDSYLIRCVEDGDIIGYDVLDAAEIDLANSESGKGTGQMDEVFLPGQRIKRITHPKTAQGEVLTIDIAAEDFLGRLWRPTARFVDMADSPMRALEDTCEQLWLLTRSLRSKLLSRLALNGILYIPSSISEIRSADPAKKAGQEARHTNKVLDQLIKAASWMVQHPGQPESSLPIFMTGPGEAAEQIKFILADRELYETDMKLRRELIDRILMGLDVVPEGVKGNSETNHWGAWVNADDDLKINVKPEIETFCWAATRCILWPALTKAGWAPGKIRKTVIWYDMSAANVRTNLSEDARQALDRNLIGPTGARAMQGIKESDAPTTLESIRQFGYKNGNAYLATYGMPEAKDFDWEKVNPPKAKTGPSADSPADDPKSGPGTDSGGPNDNDSDAPKSERPA